MTAREAHKLVAGTKLRLKTTGAEVTVMSVLTAPTDEHQNGKFPLVITKEKGAVTHLLLRFKVIKK